MKKQDYNTDMVAECTAEKAFNNINSIEQWWTADFEGQSEKQNDVFTVHFGETFITVKITEFVPYKKIGWQVIDCYKHWLKDKKEWKDTTMTWEISPEKNGTKISFTHFGLLPGLECYGGCEKAWNFYVKESLFKLLMEGEGVPG